MAAYRVLLLVSSFVYISHVDCLPVDSQKADIESWPGNWFPNKPSLPTTEKTINHGNIPMGVPNDLCDNATINLQIDWLDDPVNHTCYEQRSLFEPSYDTKPLYEIQEIPAMYHAAHACMNKSIFYDEDIPTFGTHRPLWAKWGEYEFLPKQRWLHNLEHGAVAMLYHPCANRREVNKLRTLVTNCLYRHVITPFNLLTPERSLALVTWGRKLQMSAVSEDVVVQFIKESALHGPEHTSRQGQYDYKKIHDAKIVSTIDDEVLCSKNS